MYNNSSFSNVPPQQQQPRPYQSHQQQTVQHHPQSQHVPYKQPSSGRITFNRDYLLSITGFVHWVLIVILIF